MEDFADTYLAGATPIPCVRCNQTVKFADLKRVAEDLGADCLATGHYVRRVEGEHGPELHCAADANRDQSYFLFATTRAQLSFLRFPLGAMPKPQVRALAGQLGLRVAEKPDSQDICFVPQGKYQDVVKKLRPGAAAPGEIVDVEGRVVGEHDGVINYTVGQRRGLGVATGQPLFVIKLDAGKRRVIVGPRAALGVSRIALKDVNWLGDDAIDDRDILVRVRSTRPPVAGVLYGPPASVPASAAAAGGTSAVHASAWSLALAAPEEGVAPGQAAVFYDKHSTRVLGGGWIAATEP
jgi:tRNA-specific 2-thiouridylase